MPMSSIESRLAVLENKFENVEEKLEREEKLGGEFRMRVDLRLEQLLSESSQWVTVRKTLRWIGGAIAVVGSFLGWLVHYFWPNGFAGHP